MSSKATSRAAGPFCAIINPKLPVIPSCLQIILAFCTNILINSEWITTNISDVDIIASLAIQARTYICVAEPVPGAGVPLYMQPGACSDPGSRVAFRF